MSVVRPWPLSRWLRSMRKTIPEPESGWVLVAFPAADLHLDTTRAARGFGGSVDDQALTKFVLPGESIAPQQALAVARLHGSTIQCDGCQMRHANSPDIARLEVPCRRPKGMFQVVIAPRRNAGRALANRPPEAVCPLDKTVQVKSTCSSARQ